MFRKAAICIFSFTTVPGLMGAHGSGAKQIDPEKAALIQQVMDITRPDKLIPQLLEGHKKIIYEGLELSLQSQLKRQHEDPAKYRPYIDRFENDMFTMFAKRLTWDKLQPEFIAVYDETFSKEELSDIVTLYQTPSGLNLIREKMPVLMAKCVQVAQEEMGDTTDELQKFIAEFQRDIETVHTAEAKADAKQ